ncbi:MAG TPA: hypothetical protein VE053_03535 [Allosphingosinicella sp.]|nr:hypothetical protein [Allosphingosinicella sp.]
MGLIAGCSDTSAPRDQAADRAAARQERPGPAPVTDPSAPTVAKLQSRGFVRVDDEPADAPDCGPACVIDAFSAIYMGKDPSRNPPDRQFMCPVASGEMETWRCQPAEPELV